MDTCLQCNTQNLNENCIWSSLLRYDAIQNTNAVENCPLLGHDAASTGNYLPTFWANLSIPFSGVNFDPLTPEDETDRLSRNVGKESPVLAA